MNVGIIDYGMGNLLSVYNAVEYLGYDCKIIDKPSLLSQFDKLILPGVGAFEACIDNLESKNFVKFLNNEVLINKKPILGICLGMQIMASNSQEGGNHQGLGWLDAEVIPIINKNQTDMNLLHVGWNSLNIHKENKLLKNISDNADFYFIHSYLNYASCFSTIFI